MYRPSDLPLKFLNLHYIDAQEENYKRNFASILDALGSSDYKFSETENILRELRSSPEISIKSKEAFDKYRVELKEGNSRPLLEVKILVVGQGSVGKTSLVQQILHGTFDPNQTKTEGISINQWQIEGSRTERPKINPKSKIVIPKSD